MGNENGICTPIVPLFCASVPRQPKSKAFGSLTKEQFDKEIEKGMSDVKAGRVYSADAIEAEMKRDFGI